MTSAIATLVSASSAVKMKTFWLMPIALAPALRVLRACIRNGDGRHVDRAVIDHQREAVVLAAKTSWSIPSAKAWASIVTLNAVAVVAPKFASRVGGHIDDTAVDDGRRAGHGERAVVLPDLLIDAGRISTRASTFHAGRKTRSRRHS